MPHNNPTVVPVPLNVAVLFLVFNRPKTTEQVFEAIRTARPQRLYLASDGARKGKRGEAEKVQEVRSIVKQVDWPCEVMTLFRARNLGCRHAVSSAITWFFQHEEKGIILEDDCLPSQSFFEYCEELLERYENDPKVMSICGTSIVEPVEPVDRSASYRFSRYPLMWGWATWRRSWELYDVDIKDWPKWKDGPFWESLEIDNFLFRWNWTKVLEKIYRHQIDTWDYQWIFCCWWHQGLAIAPTVNLVKNLGFDESATHTYGYDPVRSNLIASDIAFPVVHPETLGVDVVADELISRHWFHITWKGFIKAYLLDVPGAQFMNRLRKKVVFAFGSPNNAR